MVFIGSFYVMCCIAFIFPFAFSSAALRKSVFFIIQQLLMFSTIVYNVVLLIISNVRLGRRKSIDILEVTDFTQISYCPDGNQIIPNTIYYHCNNCKCCQPDGSYHSYLFNTCVQPKQYWEYLSALLLTLVVFTSHLQLVA